MAIFSPDPPRDEDGVFEFEQHYKALDNIKAIMIEAGDYKPTALDRWCETHGASAAARYEFEEIVNAVRRQFIHNGPRVVLEIGTHRGDSLRIWMEEFQPALVIGVEAEESERISEGLDPIMDEACIIYGDSNKAETFFAVRDALDGLPVEFLYIDGDHDETACVVDWSLYGSLVKPGGMVVFDDASTEDGVRRVCEFIERSHYRTRWIKGPGDSGGKFILFVG